MFDIGASELLVIVIVAILVIGPKDMPAALRTAGRWVGKIRRTSAHFRAGFDAMVREAEMEEMERKWKDQNARIMAQTPADEMEPLPSAEPDADGAGAEAAVRRSDSGTGPDPDSAEPGSAGPVTPDQTDKSKTG